VSHGAKFDYNRSVFISGFEYNIGQYQWNGNLLMSTPDQLVDPNIHGAVKTRKKLA